nr:PREDICTED: uncharacterized protein LOC109034889 isoform X2 [Bemisia tabaci]
MDLGVIIRQEFQSTRLHTPKRKLLGSRLAHGSLLQQSESDDYGFLVDRGPTSDSNLKYNSKLQKEAESLTAFCFGAKKDAFCTDQCRKVARISVQRICQDQKFLSDTYKELVPCDHVGPGVCRWFRCHCHPLFEPNATKVTEVTEVTDVTLGFCKKTLLRYFELNKELGTVGFQKD